VSRGLVTEHDIDPRDLGLKRATIDDLLGKDAAYNASVVRAVLAGEEGAVRDIVLLNAAAGLVSFQLAGDATAVQDGILDRFRAAMTRAGDAIDSGAATAKLDEWIAAAH
jgi:anthranilate phosphoribosyltransferase